MSPPDCRESRITTPSLMVFASASHFQFYWSVISCLNIEKVDLIKYEIFDSWGHILTFAWCPQTTKSAPVPVTYTNNTPIQIRICLENLNIILPRTVAVGLYLQHCVSAFVT